MTTVEYVRALALGLPRSYEAVVRDCVKFRVGRLVYLAFSCDESELGFAFPREARESLVASDPTIFSLPRPSDLRFNWAVLRVDAVDDEEVRELVLDAWRMVVPQRVAREHLGD